MSYIICSRTIRGLVYDFYWSIWSSCPVQTQVKTKPQPFLNNSFSKQLKSREFITENKMVHESRLIQFFTHESRLNKKNCFTRTWKNLIISNHDSGIRKNSDHDTRGKKTRPSMLHVKSIGVLLSITEADSEQVLFISSNTWHTCI